MWFSGFGETCGCGLLTGFVSNLFWVLFVRLCFRAGPWLWLIAALAVTGAPLPLYGFTSYLPTMRLPCNLPLRRRVSAECAAGQTGSWRAFIRLWAPGQAMAPGMQIR